MIYASSEKAGDTLATIDDVARKAGVSKGTVSNVFSKKRPISKEVTERVLSAAKELGYYPNHVAASLSLKKTMIIGLRMSMSQNEALSAFETKMISGVSRECARNGYRVLLDTLPEADDATQFTVDPVDGVVLLNPRKNDPRIERYRQMDIPFVLIGRPDPPDESISYVDNNNEEAAFQVGEYLLRNGHRSVLFLNAASDMTVAQDRWNGLSAAFRKHGISLSDGTLIHYSRQRNVDAIEYGYKSVMDTFETMNYTAVITDADRVALGVLRAAHERGIRIPERLSVIALSNDDTLAESMHPKLTTLELHPDLLGMEAAALLIGKINSRENDNTRRIIRAKLVVRESCHNLTLQGNA